MSWQDNRVFITGGTGFVGSWLLNELVNRGARITILVRGIHSKTFQKLLLSDEKPDSVVLGRLEDLNLIERIINEYEIEVCFHLAAQAIVSVANKNPLSTFHSNILGTWNLLEACRRSNTLKCLIVASSDKAYGEPKSLPITEDHPLLASYPYDASKACSDILARTYYKTYGLPVAVARCSNIYGGGDLNFSRIVPGTIRSVLLDENPIIRSDGSPLRDYLYISDVVSAYIRLAENIERTDVKGQPFNFSTRKPLSVLQIVEKIIEISGKTHLKPRILGRASPEIQAQYLSSDKAYKTLNWTAKITIEKGLEETIRWFDRNRTLWIKQ